MHHGHDDRTMGRRAYLTLGLAAAASAVGVGSAPAMASEDPAPSGEVGGGEGYDRTVSPADADVVVSTREELLSALEGGSKTIYVADDAVIDLSARRITIPGGVTLASGRGREGSPGALITADERASRLFQIYEEGVRITGLRFRGHRVGYYDPAGSAWDNDSLALRAYADCEIDNCELYGWTHAAIGIGRHGSDPLDSDAHVHHCSIHDNMMEGLGYGVVVYRGDPLIEHNYFDGNRHSIAGGGGPGCSYEARYNLQGPNGLIFGFEMHRPGGDRIDVHHNTFELVENRSGNTTAAVAIRGTPGSGARVTDNWFFNPTDPGGDRLADGSPVIQYYTDAGGSGWDEVTLSGNHFGSDEPPADVGHPRETDDDRDVLTVAGRGSTAHYEFSVSDEVEKSTEYGGTINDYDSIDGSRVTGRTTREPDSYAFTGEVTDFEASAPVDVWVNGEAVDPADLGAGRDVLTVASRGSTVHYEFSVSGEVEKSTEYGGTINDYDSIAGSRVTGRTTREPDSYAFTGEVTKFEAAGPIDLRLDGETVDPDEFGDLERILTVSGRGTTAHYEFSVSGEVGKSTEYGGTINDYDSVDGSRVTGRTTREPDSFVFTGEVTDFEASAPVDVAIDGEPASLGP
ncbi:right-handed parallel beta-helix repeat-containing protein [Halalkalicoccus sp. NIPERK01]|uniref:right-handed parallel beta-helix repeat-containing protein n=1 Tax=Halalkalicoccus sp. NIPERK01 TaxID=3053469 RepID=UPI00256F3FEE|nr:right-handed parallel beta-helix repeat-containing protein [Halalkalicoccus sp. NIPERK01]MDL5362763.1 right-handed parallel beta-helix repeat-containing protein [Halalkalicoccus sp. NIPERK01]